MLERTPTTFTPFTTAVVSAGMRQSAEAIFDEVSDLDPLSRDAAIERATDDQWIRAEVRSLLTFGADATPTISSGIGAPAFDPSELIGREVEGFTIESLIGIGGMGAVYAARQSSPSRRVALKVLATSAASPSALRRFQRESQILARLDHPSIARVIVTGTLSLPTSRDLPTSYDTRPYFVMELVERGRSMTRWAEDSQPRLRALIETFAVACDAVGAGHRRGIVHLDLKPSNLLIGEDGRLHVIDYGIAKSMDALGDSELGVEAPTIDARLIGTPQYMSPEQFSHERQLIDSRSDVYSLGLILYELLTKRLPYSTHGHSLASATRVVTEAPPIAPRALDESLPHALNAIVLKAIAKTSDERYGTATELADDLRRWLRDEPILAARPTTLETLRRFTRRNRGLTLALAVAAFATFGALAASVAYAVELARSVEQEREQTAQANLRAASASLVAGDPADAMANLALVPQSMRGWEARHVKSQIQNFSLLAPTGAEVFSVAPITATNEVIGGVTEGFIVISDRLRARADETIDVRTFGERGGTIACIDASPDGSVIVATNADNRVLFIDRVSGRIRQVAEEMHACIHVGSALVGVRVDGGVVVLDALTMEVRASDAVSTAASDDANEATTADTTVVVSDVSFTPDGRVALALHRDGSMRCVDIDLTTNTISQRWATMPTNRATRAIAISPKGELAAVAWNDGTIARLDLRSGATALEVGLAGGSVFDLAISPDEHTIAASSWTNTVRLIDGETLQIRTRLGGTLTHVWGIAWSDDGSELFGRICVQQVNPDGSADGCDHIGVWKIAPSPSIRTVDSNHFPLCAAWDERSKRFVSADAQGVLRALDPVDGSTRVIGHVDGAPRSITRQEQVLAVGLTDGTTAIFTGDASGSFTQRSRTESIGDEAIAAVSLTPDGSCVGVGDAERSVAIFNTSDGSLLWKTQLPIGTVRPDRRRITKVVFLDNGARVTFGSVDTLTTRPVYRVRDGVRLQPELEHEVQEASDVITRADGSLCMVGVTGCLFHFPAIGEPRLRNAARNGGVLCADEGWTRFFVAARDGSIRVFETATLGEVMRLPAPAGMPHAIAFSDERDELAVLTSRGILQVWGGNPDDALPATSHPTAIDLLNALPATDEPSALAPPIRR